MKDFLNDVRTLNVSLPPERRLRVLLGDPPIDWSTVRGPADEDMNDWRDAHFAWVVAEQVHEEEAPRADLDRWRAHQSAGKDAGQSDSPARSAISRTAPSLHCRSIADTAGLTCPRTAAAMAIVDGRTGRWHMARTADSRRSGSSCRQAASNRTSMSRSSGRPRPDPMRTARLTPIAHPAAELRRRQRARRSDDRVSGRQDSVRSATAQC